METRKVRTPSARMLASKQGDEYEKIASTPQLATSTRERPPTLLQTPEGQLAYVKKVSEAHHQITHRSPHLHTHHPNNPMASRPRAPLEIRKVVAIAHQSPPPMEEEIDVSSNGGAELVDHNHMEEVEEEVDDVVEEIQRGGGGGLEMIQKQEKMDAQMVMNGDFSVASEVTISSMKYQGRPSGTTPQMRQKRVSNFTGETLNLKSSDLSIPNKAAHFLYFRCYEEHEVQKEFPLTIDENRKGPQNFLVEPRVGLKNTDYYIDSYLWNRGKSTSSKKKIFVEIEGNHVKTSRRSCETAHYVLNWYYSNMENRICKKVCWLETVADCVRASPVLVQYHVNYLSDNPIELRKTPKLYSDTRSVAQELLRSDSPLQTVQRFVETGETDPREIINKKQAYEMRRYVMANARKRGQRKFEDMYFDDEMFEEIYYNEHGEPINVRNTTNREQQSDAGRAAQLAVRMEGRRIENRIARMLDNRLPAPKNYADILSEWIGALESTSQDNFHMVIHDVVNSMRKQMDDMLGGGEHEHEFLVDEPTTSGNSGNAAKRMKLMGEEEEMNHDVVEEEEDEDGHTTTRRVERTTKRFEGERYIFDGQEYVEEEVIAEEIEEVVVPSDTVVVDETTVVVGRGERGDADETNGEKGEEVVHEEVVVEETVPEEH